MKTQTVSFEFNTGIKRTIFRNPRLSGSWDADGHPAAQWSEWPMRTVTGADGCPAFVAEIAFPIEEQGRRFRWGVVLDGPQGVDFWGIPTEIADPGSNERHREFVLGADPSLLQTERYYFCYGRRLGANKFFVSPGDAPKLRFALWAPNAQSVEVVFGKPEHGYISDRGTGIDRSRAAIALAKTACIPWDGIWEGTADEDFETLKGLPYLYRLRNAQGRIVYRTDIFSRSQIGKGNIDPDGRSWTGSAAILDGTVSCSLVIDPDRVRRNFKSAPAGRMPALIPAEQFWANEFSASRPVPTLPEELVIYELHVGSLGFGKDRPGDLSDALAFVDHLVDLGVNAVELLPLAEFSGNTGWGYGDSHHFCIESSAGGRDKYRHFVRKCHQSGIAVIQDVVYNHFDPEGKRAQWQYDSTAPEQNIYYWFEGRASEYAQPEGGYLDNGSTGYTPRYSEEVVRQQFISSAVFLIEEMHVDGFRVDLTQAIHRDNVRHADGHPVPRANQFGIKFLREWSRTLLMIKPTAFLIAEDHTGWDAVTKPAARNGLGFRLRWDAAFYHDLIGDSDMAAGHARVLKQAGFGAQDALRLDGLARSLAGSGNDRVVFTESHDEAANSSGSARTISVAVNGAPLIGATRSTAEARDRLCLGLALLSAGTPMFFMGEEIGAQKPYRYNNFIENREDILGERRGDGARLFHFYQALIGLSLRLRAIRRHNIDVLHVSNENRVIAFKRWTAAEQIIVVASFNNAAFSNGYLIEKDALAIPDGLWKEVFNSDAAIFGGANIGNCGAAIPSRLARLEVVIPANGFVVLVRQ
ncbi:alpha-amylase family glycosyl hydrolase [Niveibacterium terrae]|uniref:alpha-amylase family glycosyl hydrolase n=1 Tax=Niveibacterium terrae TaxID=3373598 RepID=UPI003A8D6459